MFEPVHGSAPTSPAKFREPHRDVLIVAMMLDFSGSNSSRRCDPQSCQDVVADKPITRAIWAERDDHAGG